VSDRYVGWICERGHWSPLVTGDLVRSCHAALIAMIRVQARVPQRTAVLPVGTHPDTPRGGQDARSGPPAGRDGRGPARGTPKGRGAR
jgi:hypothetical protein